MLHKTLTGSEVLQIIKDKLADDGLIVLEVLKDDMELDDDSEIKLDVKLGPRPVIPSSPPLHIDPFIRNPHDNIFDNIKRPYISSVDRTPKFADHLNFTQIK